MIKEWATVVSWQQGVALLRCEPRAGCASCTVRSGCGARAFSQWEPGHHLRLPIAQPLQPGQRVEVGIAEGSLLRSAMLVYIMPLLGMMLGGGLLQWWSGNDAAAALAAIAGGAVAFLIVRRLAKRLGERQEYQPVVLQIGLPPGALHIQTTAETLS